MHFLFGNEGSRNVDPIFTSWECSDSQNYNLNQAIAQHVPSKQPVICLVWNSCSAWKLNNSKPQFHLHCRWSAQRPWEIPHGDRGRSAISIQGRPLIVINGVLPPYKWPDINRWLGWFHPWVFGPTLPWWQCNCWGFMLIFWGVIGSDEV